MTYVATARRCSAVAWAADPGPGILSLMPRSAVIRSTCSPAGTSTTTTASKRSA